MTKRLSPTQMTMGVGDAGFLLAEIDRFKEVEAENQRLREAAKPFLIRIPSPWSDDRRIELRGFTDDQGPTILASIIIAKFRALAEAVNPGDKEPK